LWGIALYVWSAYLYTEQYRELIKSNE
jgi:hypothetical protein